MEYKFEFRPYQRQFRVPVKTSHGTWDLRKGIILRLTDEKGKEGFGEIAPVSWLGSETFEQALDFCQQLPKVITPTNIFSVPDELPACQFGIESAWETITTHALTLSGMPLEDCQILLQNRKCVVVYFPLDKRPSLPARFSGKKDIVPLSGKLV